MKKEDNRGLSTVIATLLIILLVIVAVAIIWGVIRTIINRSSEDISLGKFTIDLEILSVIQPRNETNIINTNIKVKRNPGEGELEGIIFSIFDGKNTSLYEKRNITLNQLEIKTFVVDYTGKIVSVSIFPILKTSSGKTTTGDIADTYYYIGGDNGGVYIPTNCIPNCTGKTACQDNGCGGNCGLECSGSTPYCISGTCKADSGGIERDCSCQTTTCIGTTCDDGLGGSCIGTLSPDCNNIACGDVECGSCGECEGDAYCDGGVCKSICISDCTGKECGSDGCGGTCGWCETNIKYNISYTCNISSLCEMCIPDCTGGRNCGTALNGCGVCGQCNETRGELCNSSGICVSEVFLNNGTIFSVWPSPIGRLYFDSDNLPKSGVSYTGNYVRIKGGLYDNCFYIFEFFLPNPVKPGDYNMSYMKISTFSTNIEPGYKYEIWKTPGACAL